MAKILLEAVDPRKCIIKLSDDQYHHHILVGHVDVKLEWIEQTIEQPSFICQDADSPIREVFYKMYMFPNPKLWMCVVVERNSVITAYRARGGKKGETIIWKPKP